MRRELITSAAAVLGVLSGPAPAPAQLLEAGHLSACPSRTPVVISVRTAPTLHLHVHVVLDEGVTVEQGRAVIDRAAVPFAPLGIELQPSFTTTRSTSDDVDDLLIEMRSLFGGARPPWAHAVFLMTRRDIVSAGSTGVMGQAECVGGLAHPESAFAVGEVGTAPEPFGPITYQDVHARVVAHEIGHLLGAQHHLAECATGATEATTDGAPCTLMVSVAGLGALKFSPANAAIVRGYASEFLPPVTASAPPDGSPALAPERRPCRVTAYRDPLGDHAVAFVNNPPDVDLAAGTFRTSDDGFTRFRWTLAELKSGHPGVTETTPLRYRLDIESPAAVRIEATWGGGGAPEARALAGSRILAELPATIETGTDGYIEVELPLAALGLAAGPLELGYLTAATVDEYADFDVSAPLRRTVRPGGCPSAAPSQPAGAGAPARLARLELIGRGDRRLRVRVTGDLRDVRIRLVDPRRREVSSRRLARVAGFRDVVLALGRRPRRGMHTLLLTARHASGQAVAERLRLKLRSR